MRNVFYVNGGKIGGIQIYQLPLTKEWLHGGEKYNTSHGHQAWSAHSQIGRAGAV